MVNVPLFFILYIGGVSVAYGLVGAGMWFVGRKRNRLSVERIGYSIALGSGCIFLAYVTAAVLWVWLYEGKNSIGLAIGLSLLFSAPFAVLVPPLIAWILYVRDSIRQHIHRSLGLSFGVVGVVLSLAHVSMNILY